MYGYPKELLTLIAHFKKFPGVGSKTAERFVFHLINWPEEELSALSKKIAGIKENIYPCPECGCLMDNKLCNFCTKGRRDESLMCLISSPKNAFALEETRAYKGLYHVIGTLLSPLEGHIPDQLEVDRLKERLKKFPLQEVIIAFDSTLEGDATALFFKQHLESWGFTTSRLALGLPMGSSLDFVDFGTLEKALIGRQKF